MTIKQIERRLAHEFPGRIAAIMIQVCSNGESHIRASCTAAAGSSGSLPAQVNQCRTINHAIECLKEKLAPVRIGHVEIEA